MVERRCCLQGKRFLDMIPVSVEAHNETVKICKASYKLQWMKPETAHLVRECP